MCTSPHSLGERLPTRCICRSCPILVGSNVPRESTLVSLRDGSTAAAHLLLVNLLAATLPHSLGFLRHLALHLERRECRLLVVRLFFRVIAFFAILLVEVVKYLIGWVGIVSPVRAP